MIRLFSLSLSFSTSLFSIYIHLLSINYYAGRGAHANRVRECAVKRAQKPIESFVVGDRNSQSCRTSLSTHAGTHSGSPAKNSNGICHCALRFHTSADWNWWNAANANEWQSKSFCIKMTFGCVSLWFAIWRETVTYAACMYVELWMRTSRKSITIDTCFDLIWTFCFCFFLFVFFSFSLVRLIRDNSTSKRTLSRWCR